MKQAEYPRPPARREYAFLPAFALLGVLLLAGPARAQQWTTSANSPSNISNSNAGNVGVGTAAPAYGLHVEGASTATNNFVQGFFKNTNPSLPYGGVGVDGVSQSHVRFMLGGSLKWQWRVGAGTGVDDLRAYNWALGQDVLTMTNSGNVGVGTASPLSRLHVEGGAALGSIRVSGAGMAVMNFKDTAAPAGQKLYQWRSQGGVFRMTLLTDDEVAEALPNILAAAPSGNLGVGTDSPGARLDVGAGAPARGLYTDFLIGGGGNNPQLEFYGAARSSAIAHDEALGGLAFYTNGPEFATPFFVGNNGRVGVGTTSPGASYRLDVAGSVNSSGLCLGGDCKTAWSQVSSQWASGPGSGISYGGGNVGIGTASPAYKLQVVQGSVGIQNSGGDATVVMTSGVNNEALTVGWGNGGKYAYLQGGVWGVEAKPIVLQAGGGNVGIGPVGPTPAHTLEVAGTIHATGAITGATVSATYQDVAEWVPSSQKLQAGTVVVLDAGKVNHVVASAGAYDTKVAGVVSSEPGVILGVPGEGRVKVATTGRVRVKVDASRGAIRVGDLLVTSDVEGVAMKSVPVDLGGTPIHRPGTIVGKALEPLEKGAGEILVLLSLQ